ncbi:MAG: DUF2510 domain-containing protein [Solirubrobacterales bacterium]
MASIDPSQQVPQQQQAPAGWYPSPTDTAQEQYWDGSAWADQFRLADPRARKAAEREQSKAEKAAAKEKANAEKEAAKERDRQARERQAYLNWPPGKANTAFERGDHVFQYSIEVMSQSAVIVSMVGSSTTKTTSDPVEILNAVCHQGWELINGDFVFVQEGQQSRDKLMSSGQNVAIKGTVMGYYLFRRCEANRAASDA